MSERSLTDSHGQLGILLTLSAVRSRRHSYHSQADSAGSLPVTRSTREKCCNRCGCAESRSQGSVLLGLGHSMVTRVIHGPETLTSAPTFLSQTRVGFGTMWATSARIRAWLVRFGVARRGPPLPGAPKCRCRSTAASRAVLPGGLVGRSVPGVAGRLEEPPDVQGVVVAESSGIRVGLHD
jgi:hypothetical protein